MSPRALIITVAVAASGLAGAACGGQASPHGTGRALFAQACGTCHSLSGVTDPRLQGGDLLRFHAPESEMTQLAGEMPVRRRLSEAELEAVVRYVMATESHGR
ncbi:MAG TPA: cytochrome c [Solirubrobacteraceae bacterium]|nr:cytochrome c [Solirubrobacteraceae bacterium]